MIEKTFDVNKIPGDLYRKLYSLNYRHRGFMQEKLSFLKNSGEKGIVKVICEDSIVIGWGLAFDFVDGIPLVYFYVRQKHRRMGIGTRLKFAFLNDYDEIVVEPGGDSSWLTIQEQNRVQLRRKFFKKGCDWEPIGRRRLSIKMSQGL